jgi:hypothetical protein
MKHVYNDTFFDYIDQSAHSSARCLIAKLYPMLRPKSVIDLGSGRGIWLAEWQKAGASDVLGIDGDYVDRTLLAVEQASFLAADLTQPVRTNRRFDLAQSLEVGEHLPISAAETLVDSLTAASDRVLFSAAVTGQGGEYHVNEQPLAYWEKIFKSRGFRAYDCLRPYLKDDKSAAPWYRYNSILYVNDAGRIGLPDEVLQHEIPADQIVQDGGDALWLLRKTVVSRLPRNTVTQIAKVRAAAIAALMRFRKLSGSASA